MSEPQVYETTWHGNGWRHRARVWRGPNGKACGEWFNNGMAGDEAKEPKRSGHWVRFTHEDMPAALLAGAIQREEQSA